MEMFRRLGRLSLFGFVLALRGCGVTQPPTTSPNASATTAAPTASCQVGLPAAWTAALAAGKLTSTPGEDQQVIASSADGASLFVQATKGGKRTLDWVRRTGRSTVMQVTDPVNDQFIEGGFDGRWVVFGVSDNPQAEGSATVYAWDSRTGGAPRKLSDGAAGPVVHGGKAAWVDAYSNQVHLYDLASGRDIRLPAIRPGLAFFTDSWLVWEDGSDHASRRLHAVDPATAAPVTLPPTLSSTTSLRYVNGGGQTVVWTLWDGDAPGRTLMGWRPGWAKPRPLAVTPDPVEWPSVSGDLASFIENTTTYVADLRSGSYTRFPPNVSYLRVVGDALVVSYATANNRIADTISVVKASQLPPLPKCN
jgi:hypothetical protein